jgi:hypothetical protein
MKRPLLVALTAASLLRAEAASGSSCGGGGGGGGGGASGGGGGGGGGGAPPCIDDTDVVGYRRCNPFAAWSDHGMPLLIIELGAAVRRFGSQLGAAGEDEPFTSRASGRPAGADTAEVGTLRVGVGLGRGFYLAVDGELGRLTRTAARAETAPALEPGTPSVAPGPSLAMGLSAAAGVRGAVGRVTLGVEVAGGVRGLVYRDRVPYLACESTTTHQVSSPILEARARASLWLSPFVSVGASVGASVIERGAWMAGVQLGFATRAFGGLLD